MVSTSQQIWNNLFQPQSREKQHTEIIYFICFEKMNFCSELVEQSKCKNHTVSNESVRNYTLNFDPTVPSFQFLNNKNNIQT